MSNFFNKIKKEHLYLGILFIVCLFFFFFQLGSYKLIDVDEPRYAEAAREMIESKDFITPYFNYNLRFEKPALFYWLIAGSYSVFGVNEFAARFPSALLAMGLVFLTYLFAKKIISKEVGFISGLVLATSLEFIAMGRMSITDMTLAFFICATVIFGILADFYQSASKTKFWLWMLAYVSSGLAILTKGPVGFVLPAGVFGIYYLLVGKLKENLHPKYVLPGLTGMLAVSAPWYYLIIKEHGMLFIEKFFIRANFERFVNKDFGHHHHPFWFYIPVILGGSFPWLFHFISSLVNSFKELSSKVDNKAGMAFFKNADNRTKLILASLVWFLVVFLFFSTSTVKLITYVLACFPAMAVLIGILWNDYILDNKNLKTITFSTIMTSIISVILAGVLAFGINLILPRDEKLLESFVNYPLIISLVIIPVLQIIFLIQKQKIKLFFTNILLMGIILLGVVNTVLPMIYKSGQQDLITSIEFVKEQELEKPELATFDLVKPSITFYAQMQVPEIENESQLQSYLSKEQPVFLITRTRNLTEISKRHTFFVLLKGKKYSLITNKEIK